MAGSEDEDEDEDLVVSSCDLDRFDMVVTWGELERIKMKKVGKLGREVSVGLWECVFSRCVRGHLKPPRRRLGCLWLCMHLARPAGQNLFKYAARRGVMIQQGARFPFFG
jgi:hypothetical protein